MASTDADLLELDGSLKVVMHLMVIGFHPRTGYRVEFCTPPLDKDVNIDQSNIALQNEISLPEEWECIRYLALPDGAHNHDRDTIYFNMPPTRKYADRGTVFGVSCYRQIYVTNRVGDGARGSIQKSVCILTSLPLFPFLESKLRFVTEAFFDQIELRLKSENAAFEAPSEASSENRKNNKSLMETPETMLEICFDHIKLMLASAPNFSKSNSPVCSPKNADNQPEDLPKNASENEAGALENLLYEQLPLSKLFSDIGASKILLLFKLALMQPRIVFYGPRALPIGQLMLSICALFPKMLPKGLSSCHCQSNLISQNNATKSSNESFNEDIDLQQFGIDENDYENIRMQNIPNYSDSGQSNGKRQTSPIHASKSEFNLSQNRPNASQLSSSNGQIYQPQPNIGSFPNHSTNKENAAQELKGRETSEKCLDQVDANSLMIDHSKNLKILNEDSAIGSGSTEKIDAELLTEAELLPRMLNVASVGYPVQIYKNGAMWLPYASLHQLSALQNSNQAFSVGCTNALFVSQYGGLASDVVVTVDEENVTFEWKNHELKKLLHLSTEDIRFSNELTAAAQRHVKSDGIEWDGSEQHLRLNFNLYLSAMFMCIANKDARQISCFYGPYCRAFERTEAFKHWLHFLLKSSKWAAEFDMNAMLHPGNAMSATSSLTGALNMKLEDVSLRWSHASSVSERYRKYNETKKAVATAARSAFDNFRSKGAKISRNVNW